LSKCLITSYNVAGCFHRILILRRVCSLLCRYTIFLYLENSCPMNDSLMWKLRMMCTNYKFDIYLTLRKFRSMCCNTKIKVAKLSVLRKSAEGYSLNNQRIFNDQSVDNTGRLCLSMLPSFIHKVESHCSLTKYKKRNTVFSMFVINLFHEEHKLSNILVSLVYMILVPLLNSLNPWGNLIYIF